MAQCLLRQTGSLATGRRRQLNPSTWTQQTADRRAVCVMWSTWLCGAEPENRRFTGLFAFSAPHNVFIRPGLPGWIPRSLLRSISVFSYINAPELAPGLFTRDFTLTFLPTANAGCLSAFRLKPTPFPPEKRSHHAKAPHPVPLPIGWGEGGRRPGEGLAWPIHRYQC
jgi:hypothetical protein